MPSSSGTDSRMAPSEPRVSVRGSTPGSSSSPQALRLDDQRIPSHDLKTFLGPAHRVVMERGARSALNHESTDTPDVTPTPTS